MKKQVSTRLKISLKLFLLILLISQTNCSESDYTKLVKTEMAKNIVNDSLVFGMKFGETRQDIYDQCWKLNNKGIIMQGPQNNFVQYDLPLKKGDSTQYVNRMLFYGIFNKDRIITVWI